jgi:hypothetical protein
MYGQQNINLHNQDICPIDDRLFARKNDDTADLLVIRNVKPCKRGHTVAQCAVVKALRYKPEGSGIDSRWCHWNFSLT